MEASGDSAGIMSFAPLVLIIVVMYFLMIRPQQQKIKKHREMVAAIKPGDTIITAGGVLARVSRVVDEEYLTAAIASGVEVHLTRSMVANLVETPIPNFLTSGESDRKQPAKRKARSPRNANKSNSTADDQPEEDNNTSSSEQ